VNPVSVSQNVNVVAVVSVRMTNKKYPNNLKVTRGHEITKKTKLSKIMQEKPEAVQVLFEAGMGCCGCPMAQDETLEDGCKGHGMSDKDVDKLVERLNKK